MIQNEQERAEWRKIRKEANATPDPEIHMIRGLEWAKNEGWLPYIRRAS